MGKIIQAFDRLYNEHTVELTHLLHKIPAVAETFRQLQDIKNIPEFEVHLPPEIWKRIQEGSAYFAERKDSFLTASIHDAKTGTILKQVGLSEKSQELFSPEFFSSLNQVSVHTALANISQRLEAIDRKIDDVLHGQRDDRLGLIDSRVLHKSFGGPKIRLSTGFLPNIWGSSSHFLGLIVKPNQ